VVCLLIGATHASGKAAAKSPDMERTKIDDIAQWTITEVTLWAEKHLSSKYAKEIKKFNDRVIDGKRLVKLEKDFGTLGFDDDKMKDDKGKNMKDHKGKNMKTRAFLLDQIKHVIANPEWGLGTNNTKTRQDVTAWAEENLKQVPKYLEKIKKYNAGAIDGKILLSDKIMEELKNRKFNTNENDNNAMVDKIKFLKREGAYQHKMDCMTAKEITEWAKENLPKQAKKIEVYNDFEVPVFDAERLLSLTTNGPEDPKTDKVITELEKWGFGDKEKQLGDKEKKNVMLREINLLKNGPKLPWFKAVGEVNLSAMSPSELVLHRRRLAHGTCVSPVLAALMNEIDEAKRNHQPRRR